VSAWEIKERIGKLRSKAFDRWIEVGVIEAAGDDGKWDGEVLSRVDAAIQLEQETRTLARRAFRLTLLDFPLPPAARRAASLEVLRRVRPKSGKMAQVRREHSAAARRTRGQAIARRRTSFRHPVDAASWARALEIASDGVFHPAWEYAARVAVWLPSVARDMRINDRFAIPYEERVVLLLVDRLLQQPYVINRLGIARTLQG
jgi:hypothetical protein